MKMFATLLVAAVLCVSVVAQEKPAEKKAGAEAHKAMEKKAGEKKPAAHEGMPMPKPAPEMVKLSKLLVGTWNTEEKFEPGEMMPQGGTGKGTETVKPGPGGLSLVADYKSAGPMGSFRGHGVIWWDAKEKGYKSVWCDNMTPAGCEAAHGLGKWEGNDVVFTDEQEMMGKKMAVKETYTDITPNSFTFAFDMGPVGGELKRSMTFKYTRAEGKAAEKPAEAPKKK